MKFGHYGMVGQYGIYKYLAHTVLQQSINLPCFPTAPMKHCTRPPNSLWVKPLEMPCQIKFSSPDHQGSKLREQLE